MNRQSMTKYYFISLNERYLKFTIAISKLRWSENDKKIYIIILYYDTRYKADNIVLWILLYIQYRYYKHFLTNKISSTCMYFISVNNIVWTLVQAFEHFKFTGYYDIFYQKGYLNID